MAHRFRRKSLSSSEDRWLAAFRLAVMILLGSVLACFGGFRHLASHEPMPFRDNFLFIGAGLFTRSLLNLKNLDPGFRADSVVAFTVDPSLNGYGDARKNDLYRRIQEDIAAESGVSAVSMAELGLLAGNDSSSTVQVEGYLAKEDEDMNPNFNGVGPDFFHTLGIPLLSGREFTEQDAAGAPKGRCGGGRSERDSRVARA